jgi:GH15 family glucan-1,4-alpha-glucosidase
VPPAVQTAVAALEQTAHTWRHWAANIQWEGPYRQSIVRSAITLKQLIYEPTGAVVAAGTTSLPEDIGGVRNWDYRYTWFRDASFTLNALYSLGCRREAHRWAKWMLEAVVQHGLPLRVLYSIDGAIDLPEGKVPDVEGYRGSRPVRVGNGAETQFQLDIYGELMDCLSICEIMGDETMRRYWPQLRELANFICDHWREPDSGIWEVRDKPRHFVYSKAMAWVGLDRALRLQRHLGADGEIERWAREAQALRDEVMQQGLSVDGSYFTRAYGETALDASLLQLSISGFIEGADPMAVGTIEAVSQALAPRNAQIPGLLLRYPADAGDGLPGEEGAFTLCSFWLVEALALAGRRSEAEELFERLLGLQGVLGLYAEEIDPASGAQLGNFPQAFTHIGLINAALRLRQRSAKGHPDAKAHATLPIDQEGSRA